MCVINFFVEHLIHIKDVHENKYHVSSKTERSILTFLFLSYKWSS